MKLTRLSAALLPDCGGWTVVEEVGRESLRGKQSGTGITGLSMALRRAPERERGRHGRAGM